MKKISLLIALLLTSSAMTGISIENNTQVSLQMSFDGLIISIPAGELKEVVIFEEKKEDGMDFYPIPVKLFFIRYGDKKLINSPYISVKDQQVYKIIEDSQIAQFSVSLLVNEQECLLLLESDRLPRPSVPPYRVPEYHSIITCDGGLFGYDFLPFL